MAKDEAVNPGQTMDLWRLQEIPLNLLQVQCPYGTSRHRDTANSTKQGQAGGKHTLDRQADGFGFSAYQKSVSRPEIPSSATTAITHLFPQFSFHRQQLAQPWCWKVGKVHLNFTCSTEQEHNCKVGENLSLWMWWSHRSKVEDDFKWQFLFCSVTQQYGAWRHFVKHTATAEAWPSWEQSSQNVVRVHASWSIPNPSVETDCCYQN